MEHTQQTTPPKTKMGRPPGSRNKRGITKTFDNIYKKIEGMLNDEQRDYYRKVFQGKADFDPVMLGELFMLQYTVYVTEVLSKAMDESKASQDIAKTLAEYRMGLKDVEDMKRRREEIRSKTEKDERLVDTTRQPELVGIARIIGGSFQEGS